MAQIACARPSPGEPLALFGAPWGSHAPTHTPHTPPHTRQIRDPAKAFAPLWPRPQLSRCCAKFSAIGHHVHPMGWRSETRARRLRHPLSLQWQLNIASSRFSLCLSHLAHFTISPCPRPLLASHPLQCRPCTPPPSLTSRTRSSSSPVAAEGIVYCHGPCRSCPCNLCITTPLSAHFSMAATRFFSFKKTSRIESA